MTPIDIVILTIISDEYQAVRKCIKNCQPYIPTNKKPNIFAWELGRIYSPLHKSCYHVAVGIIGEAGETKSAVATSEAINLWHPQYIVLCGIAGGLNGPQKGDVIIADTIYAYEYSKLADEVTQRFNWTYNTDPGLTNKATSYAAKQTWQKSIKVNPPQLHEPRFFMGEIASGNKVVDNPSNAFFSQVLELFPKIAAVEMEGAGACEAINFAHSKKQSVGFMMVRGISDLPRKPEDTGPAEEQRGTEERDNWKPYASNVAAAFLCGLIKSGLPFPPKSIRLPQPTKFSSAQLNQIIQKSRRFLDSLDSARFSSEKSHIDSKALSVVYVKIQFLLSLLMGNSIVISENQFFDSLGFLESFFEISEVIKDQGLTIPLPLIIALRDEKKDVFYAVSKNLRNQKFSLTLWHDLSGNRRLQWADDIFARQKPQPQNDNEASLLEKLWRALEYFTPEKCIEALTIPNQFSSGIGMIAELKDREIEALLTRKNEKSPGKKYFPNITYCDAAKQIRDVLFNIRLNNPDLSTRSFVREQLESIKNRDLKQGVYELIDAIYNQTLGIATGAVFIQNSFFPPRRSNHVIAAYSLATYIQDQFLSHSVSSNWEIISFDYYQNIDGLSFPNDRIEILRTLEEGRRNFPWKEVLFTYQNPIFQENLLNFRNCLHQIQELEKDLQRKDFPKSIEEEIIRNHNGLQQLLITLWKKHINFISKQVKNKFWKISPSEIVICPEGITSENDLIIISYSPLRTKLDLESDEKFRNWQQSLLYKGRFDEKAKKDFYTGS